MSRRAAVATFLLIIIGTTSCVAPASSNDGYQRNARLAVGSGLSEAATAHLIIEQLLRSRTPLTYADVVITDNENAIGPIEASFGSVQPPSDADDRLRMRVLDLLGTEGDLLADARIAVRRGDTATLKTIDDKLSEMIKRLDAIEQALR